MAKPFDLEELREILKDQRTHISVAIIKRLEMATDRSTLRLVVSLFPDEREMIVRMAWETVGPSAGVYQLPTPGDMVLVGFADGHEDHAYVLRRLSSREDKIPVEADSYDLVMKALAGKKARMISDTAVWLSKPGSTPTEPIPLGIVLRELLSDVLAKLISTEQKLADLQDALVAHTHVGNFGFPTSAPINLAAFSLLKVDFLGLKSDLTDLKASPVDDNEINSDLSFTEKGS